MRLSSRQMIWHCRALPSEATASTKLSGNQIGLLISIAAPVAEILRMTQSILQPLNSMVPAFRIRWRGEVRRSSINTAHEGDGQIITGNTDMGLTGARFSKAGR